MATYQVSFPFESDHEAFLQFMRQHPKAFFVPSTSESFFDSPALPGPPLTDEEVDALLVQGLEEAERGELTPLEEFKKEFEQWRKERSS